MFAKNWPSLISRFIFASFSFLMIYFLFFSQAPIHIVNARAHVRSFVRSRESTYPPPNLGEKIRCFLPVTSLELPSKKVSQLFAVFS